MRHLRLTHTGTSAVVVDAIRRPPIASASSPTTIAASMPRVPLIRASDSALAAYQRLDDQYRRLCLLQRRRLWLSHPTRAANPTANGCATPFWPENMGKRSQI